jgi:hypothetical protein
MATFNNSPDRLGQPSRYRSSGALRQTDPMAVVAVTVMRGKDGKYYPVPRRRPAAVNQRAADLIHAMRCARHMTFKQIDQALPGYGLRISHGSVVQLWQATECAGCASVPPEPPPSPDPRQRPQVFEWR